MTKRYNGVTVICVENPQQCDECGKIAELRPYGKNNACICYECGQKNKELTDRKMKEMLFGVSGEVKP